MNRITLCAKRSPRHCSTQARPTRFGSCQSHFYVIFGCRMQCKWCSVPRIGYVKLIVSRSTFPSLLRLTCGWQPAVEIVAMMLNICIIGYYYLWATDVSKHSVRNVNAFRFRHRVKCLCVCTSRAKWKHTHIGLGMK